MQINANLNKEENQISINSRGVDYHSRHLNLTERIKEVIRFILGLLFVSVIRLHLEFRGHANRIVNIIRIDIEH